MATKRTTTAKKPKATPTLSRAEQKRIEKLGAHWQLDAKHKHLSATFTFANYLEALMFVTRISIYAEVHRHHPEVCLSYGKVKITLTTHDAGAVTDLDITLAEAIERVLSTQALTRPH